MPVSWYWTLFIALGCMAAAGCKGIEPVGASDADARLNEPQGQAAVFEEYYQEVREGASAPGLIRGSGGCGCN